VEEETNQPLFKPGFYFRKTLFFTSWTRTGNHTSEVGGPATETQSRCQGSYSTYLLDIKIKIIFNF